MMLSEPLVVKSDPTMLLDVDGAAYVRTEDRRWLPHPCPSEVLDAGIRRLYASVVPADVQRAIDLRQRFARRLRRFEARRGSGPGRRRARGYHEERER